MILAFTDISELLLGGVQEILWIKGHRHPHNLGIHFSALQKPNGTPFHLLRYSVYHDLPIASQGRGGMLKEHPFVETAAFTTSKSPLSSSAAYLRSSA